MRLQVALAAFTLLALAAWVSIGGNGDGHLFFGPMADNSIGLAISDGDSWSGGGDYRPLGETPDRRLAGLPAGAEEIGIASLPGEESPVPLYLPTEVVDDNPYLEPALAYYSVEEFRDALIHVRFEESSNQVVPCVVGDALERGPYQFMAGTWASTPYAHLNPCDLEAATWAAAWFVSEGRWLEWSTWPR